VTETLEIAPRMRPRWPGRAALACGILTPLAVAAGVAATQTGAFEFATAAAWTAIGASILAVVVGGVAIIGNWDRGAGIAGLAVGILGNPLVLLHGLGAVGSV
jgi:hypothetical protein